MAHSLVINACRLKLLASLTWLAMKDIYGPQCLASSVAAQITAFLWLLQTMDSSA